MQPPATHDAPCTQHRGGPSALAVMGAWGAAASLSVAASLAVLAVGDDGGSGPGVIYNDGTPLVGFQKFLLTDAAKRGARCLDGSPGGGYIRRGNPKKWIIFHQGGGWCTSDASCAQRANCSNSPKGCIMGGTCCALGSSTVWGPTYTDKYEGSQIFADPEFADYTAVYAMYCDGGSWTGNQASPVPVGSSTIYYQGRRLLDALIDYALAQGLSSATNLLFGGCECGRKPSCKQEQGTGAR